MSEFLFKKSQRVIVPTKFADAAGVQAVIVANSARLGHEPSYTLQWPSADMVQEHGQLVPREATIAESVLRDAQPAAKDTRAADDINYGDRLPPRTTISKITSVNYSTPCGPIDPGLIHNFPLRDFIKPGKRSNAHGAASRKSKRRSTKKKTTSRKRSR